MNIIKVEKAKNVIIHVIDTGGSGSKRFKYSTIRCGLAWPGVSWPGYYVVIGEELPNYIDRFDGNRKSLKVFTEQEYNGVGLDELFDKLTDDLVYFGCKEIYADISESNESFKEYFYKYQDKQKLRGFSLLKAPWHDNWFLGVSLIKEKLAEKTLHFEENSFILEQLRRIQKSDLENEPHKRFWAIEAIRHPLAALKKYPTILPEPDLKRRGNLFECDTGWMAV